jgi:hypothetical protein
MPSHDDNIMLVLFDPGSLTIIATKQENLQSLIFVGKKLFRTDFKEERIMF